ncbi:MAG: hypothetical protein CL913_00515 [Deltaproteobacteria bacterium]|nr:hypothetical protein [Deltaproteobacteria bacterium]
MRLELSQEATKEMWSQQTSKWVCWSELVKLKGEKLANYTYQRLKESESPAEMKPNLEAPQDEGTEFHAWEKMVYLVRLEESTTRNTTKESKKLENNSGGVQLEGEQLDAELEGFEKATEGLGSFNRPAKKAKAKKKEEPVKTEDRPLSLLFNTFRLPFSFKAQF